MDQVKPDFVQVETPEPPINKFLKISLITLVILSLSLGSFIFLQINKITTPKTASIISPTPVISDEKISPTMSVSEIESPENIDVGNVEEDLKEIENDIKGLQ